VAGVSAGTAGADSVGGSGMTADASTKSCPHCSQNRPVRGVAHCGHGVASAVAVVAAVGTAGGR
jgi:hypothetical protein